MTLRPYWTNLFANHGFESQEMLTLPYPFINYKINRTTLDTYIHDIIDGKQSTIKNFYSYIIMVKNMFLRFGVELTNVRPLSDLTFDFFKKIYLTQAAFSCRKGFG